MLDRLHVQYRTLLQPGPQSGEFSGALAFVRASLGLLVLGFLLGYLAVGHGQLFFPDEYRYFVPLNILDGLAQGQWERVTGLLRSMLDRPLYYVVYLPVLLLQWALSGFQAPRDPVSGWVSLESLLVIPGLFNVLLYLLNSLLVHRIAFQLFRRPLPGLLAQALYLIWLPDLIYTRHLLPSLVSETFLLACFSVFIATNKGAARESQRLYRQSGLLWLGSFLVYPGFYYTALAFVAGILLWQGTLREKARRLWCFIRPVVLFFAGFELICQLLFGVSYLDSLLTLSRTVNQGDLDHGLSFLLNYYHSLGPGSLGFLLLPIGLGLWGLFRAYLGRKDLEVCGFLALAFVGLQGWLVFNTSVLHSAVLYGRLLLPLAVLPILAWGNLCSVLLSAETRRWLQAVSVLLLLGFVGLLLYPIPGYLSLQYPLDVAPAFARATGIQLPHEFLHSSRTPDYQVRALTPNPETIVVSARTVQSQPGPVRPALSCGDLPQARNLYLILNREFILPIERLYTFSAPKIIRGQAFYQQPHPYLFAPYTFEGLTAQNRIQLGKTPLQMQIIHNPCSTRKERTK